MSLNSIEENLALVLATMNELANGRSGPYVVDEQIVARTGIAIRDVCDYMDILEERGLIESANAGDEHCAALTAKGRAKLRDPSFGNSERAPSIIVQGNSGVLVNINSTLSSVSQSVVASPYFQNNKEMIATLVEQLKESLQSVPPENADDTEAVVETAQALVAHADKEKPNRALLNISAEGLKQAAQGLAFITPDVLKIALQLIKVVAG